MYREKIEELKKWKASPQRKPLVIEGARQVGKTWLLKQFGESEYENVVYINFENDEFARSFFEGNLRPERIISDLQAYQHTNIIPDEALIILDEAQAAPRILPAMKYFCEEAPEYHICVAGSLLGLAIHGDVSYPVGKVNHLRLSPMNFCEFIQALGFEQLAERLRTGEVDDLENFREMLTDILKTYLYVGGMPEVVKTYADSKSWIDTRKVQREILKAYENDFGKHADGVMTQRISQTWTSISTQLARENRKFLFGLIKEGARAREYELALSWLERAGLIHIVNRVDVPKMPLAGYRDFSAYKIYLSDVGLLGAMAELDEATLLHGNEVFTEYKGALAEQFVAQELSSLEELPLYYWTAKEGRGEVDFVAQLHGEIVPLEVKAGENLRAQSLQNYITEFKPKAAIRTSLASYKTTDVADSKLIDVPLWGIRNLIERKLKSRERKS